jgi:hypothetical protein
MKGMRHVAKWALTGLIGTLAAIQFVPVDRGNLGFECRVPATSAARSVLRRACYDCHSNETVWPWYSRIAPISWKVAHDVQEGRDELNFSTWNRYTSKQQSKKLKESWEEVAEGEMPPWIYLPPHPQARLSADDRTVLRVWARSAANWIRMPDERTE